MLAVKRHKLFIKEFRKITLSEKLFSKYILYLSKLIEAKLRHKKALDHSLKGGYKDCQEFHISGDLLIIYFIKDNTLNLIRIGAHSQLFK